MNVLNGNPAASTPEGYAYATGTSRYTAVLKQDSFEGSISGSLFDLPAGPVDFVVGAEYRKVTLDLTSNADPATLAGSTPAETTAIRSNYFAGLRGVPAGALYYWLTNVGSAQGDMNVKEAFAELAVPILKDTPFFQELSLNGAARITDYSTSGTVKTWKVGATWKPVDDLLLRGTLSRDIRAPNLFELYAGAQSGIGIVNDVQVRDASGNVVYGSGQNINVNSVISGNANLQPEIGRTLTLGGVLSPRFLPGFAGDRLLQDQGDGDHRDADRAADPDQLRQCRWHGRGGMRPDRAGDADDLPQCGADRAGEHRLPQDGGPGHRRQLSHGAGQRGAGVAALCQLSR